MARWPGGRGEAAAAYAELLEVEHVDFARVHPRLRLLERLRPLLDLGPEPAARSARSFELIAASVTGLDFRPALHMRPRRAGTSGNPGRAKPEFGSRASELSTSWARNPDFWARNPDFLGPESRKSGSGFRERNPGPPARADRKPRLRGGAPSRKPGAKARPWRSEFRHRTPARVTLAPPVTSTAGPSYCRKDPR